MQDERGSSSDEMNPEGGLEEDSGSGAWYFETRGEGWERQEAKNKALQDAIRRKLNEQPVKQEPFRAAAHPEEREQPSRRRGLFGRGRERDTEPARADNRDDEWSTEPWAARPAEPPAVPEVTDHAHHDADEDPAPVSRWDAMFSAKAGDDDIVDAMRRWSESSRPDADAGEPDALPEDIESRLRAIEPPAPGAPAGFDTQLDPEVEARLQALEGPQATAAGLTERLSAEDDPALSPEIAEKLRALEALESTATPEPQAEEDGGAGVLLDDAEFPGQESHGWQEAFRVEANEKEQEAPGPLAVDAGPNDIQAWDSSSGTDSAWAALNPTVAPRGDELPGGTSWEEPESAHGAGIPPWDAGDGPDRAPQDVGGSRPADERGIEDPAGTGLPPPDPPTSAEGASHLGTGSEGVSKGEWTASEDELPAEPDDGWIPGALSAAAASLISQDEPEPGEESAWGTEPGDDAWRSSDSPTGVPADASPNWPFPEAAGSKDAGDPSAISGRQHDDPWAVSPVDELEERLRAVEQQEHQAPPSAPSAWPAQQLDEPTPWPAQADYEPPAEPAAALYSEAGVMETLDEIMGGETAPDSFPASQDIEPAALGALPASQDIDPADREGGPAGGGRPVEPPTFHLRPPVEFDEPLPGDGTARLLDPIGLVPGDEGIDPASPGAAAAPAVAGETPSWLLDEEAPDVEAGHGSRARTLIREIVETGMLAILVFLAVRASFQNFKVEGESMFPTLEDGEFLIVNRLVYSEVDMDGLATLLPWIDADEGETRHLFHGPQRGDIVVFRDTRGDREDDLIKRVIGLPGETIEIVDGRVYINDLELDEPYIKTPWEGDKSKILIPENEYFVMGDNRGNSLDSRFEQIGLVHEDLIIGKALVSYWPRSAFGLADNETPHCVGSPDCKPTDTQPEERAETIGD